MRRHRTQARRGTRYGRARQLKAISQARGQLDSRLACYRLTGDGKALRASLRPQVSALEVALAGKLGEGDVRELKRLLRRLVDFPKT